MEHTPKNVLIRAYHTGRKPSDDEVVRYNDFRKLLNAIPFLEKELGDLLRINAKTIHVARANVDGFLN